MARYHAQYDTRHYNSPLRFSWEYCTDDPEYSHASLRRRDKEKLKSQINQWRKSKTTLNALYESDKAQRDEYGSRGYNFITREMSLPTTTYQPDCWHIKIAKKDFRIFGFFYEATFYITHNDPKHSIYERTKSTLIINDHITRTSIPPKAHEYIVNGKSGLGWIVDRYQVRTDTKESGITNDPNNLFEDPRDFIKLIKQVVQVSIETVDIVNALPAQFEPQTQPQFISHAI